jgi:drug/metabolite transporter (DMT)-like permease
MPPAVAALIALSCLWGYNWVVMKEALKYAGPFDFAALRMTVGVVCLFGLLLWRRRSLRPRQVLQTIVLGLVGTTITIGAVTWALALGSVGRTAILVYTMPFWVLLLAWPTLGERIRGNQWIPTLLAFAGLLIILDPGNLHGSALGKILAVISGIGWGLGAIVTKVMRNKTEFDLVSLSTWQMFFGTIPLVALAFLVPEEPVRWTATFTACLFYSGILSNAVAVLLWFFILEKLPAGAASMGTLATPVLGMTASFIQLGERPTPWEGLGMILILAALALLSYLGYRQSHLLKLH